MEISVETAVRICPVLYSSPDLVCVQANPLKNSIQLANSQSYSVAHALPVDSCQNTVFTTTCTPLVNYLIEGCDVSVVTMGQSGTGKTYTLLGPGFHCAASEADHGIIPRFIREVFMKMKQYRDRTWSLHVTWSQICGENVQDLLGVGSIECGNISDVFQLIQLGMSNRAPKYAHTLFTLTLEQQWMVDTTVQHRISTASFADLAGTEKVLVYDSNGMMQSIPTDLGIQTLQRCIMTLSEQYPTQFNYNNIPYTQSVLTTLLKDSFGGRAKTLFLCCVSPLIQDFTETLYTLQMGIRAQTIKNYVTVNSYTTFDTIQENCDVFGLQFAANQLFKLVSNAEELFQKLVGNELLPKSDQELISQWLMLKQECEDCLSESSEPHRSLERIEEEIEDSANSTESEEDHNLQEKVQSLMDGFRSNTDKLVTAASSEDVLLNSSAKETLSSSNLEYHLKGARGRRGSILSSGDFPPSLKASKVDSESHKLIELTPVSLEAKKKALKQITTAVELNQKQISDLEKTIKEQENLIHRFLENKNTKTSALCKIEQECLKLRNDVKHAEEKFNQARLQKNHFLVEEYKNEVGTLGEKLRDTESLKNITEDDSKLRELEKNLQTSKKQLEKLKKSKQKKKKYKQLYEKQIKMSKSSCESLEKKTPELKVVALLSKSVNSVSLTSEEVDCWRHEIRNLRKTRDFVVDQRYKIDTKSQNKKLLNDVDQRKLFQFEEAIEAIDLIIEYKNSILCGNQPLQLLEESSDQMLMERFLKLSENEMRILLHRYFDKILDLRSNCKKLDMQILEIEHLTEEVMRLRHENQLVKSEADRRIVSLWKQYEDKLCYVLRNWTGEGGKNERVQRFMGSKHSAVTVQVAGSSKNVEKNWKWTTKKPEAGPRQLQEAPQARVTIEKNKIIVQKTKH